MKLNLQRRIEKLLYLLNHSLYSAMGYMPKKYTLLVADRDSKHITLMRHLLADADVRILSVRNGDLAVEMTAKEQPDLVFLEMNLEGEIDGCVVARRIRDFTDAPIIFVSASTEPDDILRAFESGADDYISKPVHGKILLARMRAVLHRCQPKDAIPKKTEIVCGDLRINIPGRQVMVAGNDVYLSETEFNLILELARNQGQVLLHEQLLSAVWGKQYASEVDYLRSYIHILRRKLENDPQRPKMIISKPGVGYMLAVDIPAGKGE